MLGSGVKKMIKLHNTKRKGTDNREKKNEQVKNKRVGVGRGEERKTGKRKRKEVELLIPHAQLWTKVLQPAESDNTIRQDLKYEHFPFCYVLYEPKISNKLRNVCEYG